MTQTTHPTATGRFDVLVTTAPEGGIPATHVIGPFSKEERATIAADRLKALAAEGGLALTTQVLPLEGAFDPKQALIFLDAALPGATAKIEAARQAAKDAKLEAAKAAIPTEKVEAAKAVAAEQVNQAVKGTSDEDEAKRAKRNEKRGEAKDADNLPGVKAMEAQAQREAGFPKLAARNEAAERVAEAPSLGDTAPAKPPISDEAAEKARTATVIEGVKADKPKPKRKPKAKAAAETAA